MDESAVRCRVVFRGEEHWLTREAILSVAALEEPRRVNAYFVEIRGVRFPPKQLIRAATGTAQFFDTAAAVRALTVLGFEVTASSINRT